jgi:hypothetical protein
MTGNRFVVQEHATPEGVHWDLMLEQGEALLTFRLAERPENTLAHPITATRIFDHALRFLTYEGPVQKGTGRVRIVERGTYRLSEEKDDWMAIDLQGVALRGKFVLMRKKGATWELAPDGRTEGRLGESA